jgi:hypothetical protein
MDDWAFGFSPFSCLLIPFAWFGYPNRYISSLAQGSTLNDIAFTKALDLGLLRSGHLGFIRLPNA